MINYLYIKRGFNEVRAKSCSLKLDNLIHFYISIISNIFLCVNNSHLVSVNTEMTNTNWAKCLSEYKVFVQSNKRSRKCLERKFDGERHVWHTSWKTSIHIFLVNVISSDKTWTGGYGKEANLSLRGSYSLGC